MNKKYFLNLSKEDCLKEYNNLKVNSEIKLKSSENLAFNGDLGSAISLLIISNEELIKALILYLDANGLSLRNIKGMKSIFNNHKLRYLLIFWFSIITIFFDDIKQYLPQMVKDKRLLNAVNTYKVFGLIDPLFSSKLNFYIKRKAVQFRQELKFYSRVDKMRQNGLYLDPESTTFSRSDYIKVHKKFLKVRFTIQEFLPYSLTDGNDKTAAIQIIKEILIKKNGYEELGQLINKINKPNINPYDEMFKFFIKKSKI